MSTPQILHTFVVAWGCSYPCKTHPESLSKKLDSKTTVFASLEKATTLQELGYIKNFCKFVANHRDIDVPFGTTRNEAFHRQLKSFYRNVMVQTRRHAMMVGDIATLVKLFAGFVHKCHDSLVHKFEEHELLRRIAEQLLAVPEVRFDPPMNHKVEANVHVDESTLPMNAKRLRKNPA